jgi:hypothetical protein
MEVPPSFASDKPGNPEPCPVGGNTTQGIAKGAMRRITQSQARLAFTFSLETLTNLGGSPVRRLREEFYPEWAAVFSNPSERYVSVERQSSMRQAARDVLARWASGCKLVTDSGSAPGWLLDYAEGFLKTFEGSNRGAPAKESAEASVSPNNHCSQIPSEPTALLGKGNALWLPMVDASPKPHEMWVDYKRRLCAALRTQWNAQQARNSKKRDLAKPARQPKSMTQFEHPQWFILYQCCNWRLAQIASCPWYDRRGGPSAEQTIWQGIRSVGKQTGLKVSYRRSALKKSAR